MSKKFVALALLGLLSTQVFMPIVFADKTVKPDIYGSFKKVKHIYLTGNGLFTNHKQFGSDSFLISSKEIDDLSVHFNRVTKRLAVSMHDTLKRDEDGWVVEPRNGSILLNKNSLKELFGSTDDVAVKDHFFRTVTVNGSKFLRVDVDDTHDCSIVVQRFVEPELKQRWFTKGCNASIRLADRAMFIEVCGRDKRGFNLSFDHPVDHSGQKVFVNKSWLESKGILHPVFEWGDKTPWKPLSYRDEGDFYVLEPEHFSTIGIHEKASGNTTAQTYDYSDNLRYVNISDINATNIYARSTIDSYSPSSTEILSLYSPIFNPVYRRNRVDGWTRSNAELRSLIRMAPRDASKTMTIHKSGGYFKQSGINLSKVDVIGFDVDMAYTYAQSGGDYYKCRSQHIFYDIRDFSRNSSELKFYGHIHDNDPVFHTYLNGKELGTIGWREDSFTNLLFNDYHSIEGMYVGNIRAYSFNQSSKQNIDDFESGNISNWDIYSFEYNSGVKSTPESGGSPYNGSYCLELEGNSYVQKNINLSAYDSSDDIFLSFAYRLKSFEDDDELNIYFWNGHRWKRTYYKYKPYVNGIDDGKWRLDNIWIPYEYHISDFKVKFALENAEESDYACLDSIYLINAYKMEQEVFYDDFESGTLNNWSEYNGVAIASDTSELSFGHYEARLSKVASMTSISINLSSCLAPTYLFLNHKGEYGYQYFNISLYDPDIDEWTVIYSHRPPKYHDRVYYNELYEHQTAIRIPPRFFKNNVKIKISREPSTSYYLDYLYITSIYIKSFYPNQILGSVLFYNKTVDSACNISHVEIDTAHIQDPLYRSTMYIKTSKMSDYQKWEPSENSSNMIFYDDFESGNLSKWDTVFGASVVASYYMQGEYVCKFSYNKRYLEKNLNLSNKRDVVLAFDSFSVPYRIKIYDGDSYHTLSISATSYTSSFCPRFYVYIPNRYLSANSKIRFEGSPDFPSYKYIDNVAVFESNGRFNADNQSQTISFKIEYIPSIFDDWRIGTYGVYVYSGQQWENQLNRTIGINFESNKLITYTDTYNLTGELVAIVVPVSTDVKGVYGVTFNGILFDEVSSFSQLVPGTFYFDASQHNVTVCIGTFTENYIELYVNCTYGGTFELTIPTFLRSGDYFMSRGLIRDADGNPIDGMIATTSIIGSGYYNNDPDSDYYKNKWFNESFDDNSNGWVLQNLTISDGKLHPDGSGNSFYKVISFDNNGYSGFYQMRVNVTYDGTGFIGWNVSCEGHCNYNFSDIRFYQIDNSTELPYWVEEKVDGSYAIIWVNVSSQAMSDGKILMYYDNSSVSSASNGDDTFLLFDDFSGSTLNNSKWSSMGDASVSDGELTVTGTSTYHSSVNSTSVFPYNTAVRSRWKYTYLAGYGSATVGFNSTISDSHYILSRAYGRTDYPNYTFLGRNASNSTSATSDVARQSDTYHVFDVIRNGTSTVECYIDDAHHMIIGGSNVSNKPCPVKIFARGTGTSFMTTTVVDWIFVRRFTGSEPVFTSASNERSSNYGRARLTKTFQHNIKNINVYIYDNTTDNITYIVSPDGDTWYQVTNGSSIQDFNSNILYVNISFNNYGSGDYVDAIKFEYDEVPYELDDQVLISTEWNCTGGNYQATIATNSLSPAVYSVEIRFTDLSSGVTFKTGDTLYLDVPISGGVGGGSEIYSSAWLYYNFIDANSGSKLEDDFYKFYISPTTSFSEASRVVGGKYPVTLGKTYYYKVLDYWNNKVYPTDADYASFFVDEAENYLDIFIPLNQFKIKNTNDSVAYIKLTNGPINGTDNTWYARWIPPYESTEMFLRPGVYNMTVQLYDVDNLNRLTNISQVPVKILYVENLTVNTDTFYWIPGYKLGDIIISIWNTNSSIMNQMINIGVYVKNMNSSIINQIVNSTYLVENINTSIRYQTNLIRMMINNSESNITNQLNVMQQDIHNHFMNITNQTNYVWQSVNNTNVSLHNQLNAVWQEVNNTNVTVVTQANMIMQQIQNTESNITNQTNFIIQLVENHNTTIVAQLNAIQQNITNSNTTIHTQLNAIQQNINNTNASIHTQLNIISQDINNANATIHVQLNTITQKIDNLNSTIDYQFSSMSQKITNFETNITGQVNSVWLSVNNTNSSIHNQLNLISADIYNMNSSIHTQINALSQKITNVETNLTNQTNLISIKITNMESNITNQINGVNMTIINHNATVMNQLNAIMSQIINTNASIIDQINLIWNEINNTNSTIHLQLNAIQTDINNANATIHTQLNAMVTQINNVETNLTNQTNLISIKITNMESNITNQINGVNMTIINHNATVMNQLNAIMSQIINTNASIIDQINLIWNEINNTNSSIQIQINGVHTTITTMWSDVNYSFSVIESDISYHNSTIVNLINDMNASLYAKLVNVLDNVSEAGESVFDKAMQILEKMGNLTGNLTLSDRLIQILNNISDTRVQILNKTLDILDVLGEKVNNMTLGNAIWGILENITSMQQHMAENFSYIGQVNVNLTNETLEMLDQIYNALLDVNATAMKDLYDILQDVLEQFRLPHEWRLPSVNYTLNDTTPPTTTVSAVVTIENNIRVSWSSVDNVPLNVAHVTLYYKVENASYWKLWRSNQASTGNLIWDEEEPVEGKTYYFMALGSDANGNNETQSDSNTCSLVYRQFVLPVSGTPSFLGKVGLTGNSLLVVIVLILFVILGVLLYVGYRLKREVK